MTGRWHARHGDAQVPWCRPRYDLHRLDRACPSSGVRLSDVLDRVGASGDTLTAIALNDYSAELPSEDARTWPVILAFSRDGKTLSVRDKGPLWIVYPRDDHAELQSEALAMGKWVWQLKAIDVK